MTCYKMKWSVGAFSAGAITRDNDSQREKEDKGISEYERKIHKRTKTNIRTPTVTN